MTRLIGFDSHSRQTTADKISRACTAHETAHLVQVPQIGKQQSGRLAGAGVKTLLQLSQLDPRRIEAIVQRSYPFGNQIKQEVLKLLVPEIKLQIHPLRESQNCPLSQSTQP